MTHRWVHTQAAAGCLCFNAALMGTGAVDGVVVVVVVVDWVDEGSWVSTERLGSAPV